MRREHRHRIEMIDGNVKEPLQLVLVEIDAEYAVDAGGLDHVRHQLRADRHARLILAILSRVAVVRHHARDTRRRCAPGGVDQEQQLHHVLRGRIRRLEDEHVVAANVFVDAHGDFAVGEASEVHAAEIHAEVARDLLGEWPVGGPGEQLEAVARYG